MFTTTMMKPLFPASRRLLALVALSAAASAWGQEAPTAGASIGQNATPAAAPTPAIAPTPAAEDTAPAAAAAAAPAASAPTDRILPAADPSSPAASTLGGTLSGNSTAVSTIQRQELPQRDRLLGELTERVQMADRTIAELQQKATGLDDQGKKALDAAIAQYNRTKTSLQQSLETARSAESNTWERARSHLASDYAFYVASAAAVEVISPN